MNSTKQVGEVFVGPGYLRVEYQEPEYTIAERQARIVEMSRPRIIAAARKRNALSFIGLIFLAALVGALFIFLLAASADAAPRTRDDRPARALILVRPRLHVFNRDAFIAESLALTASNVFDGIETVRDTRDGIWEAGFPRGSAELLGRYPSAGRYALVMAVEQALMEFGAWKLEHSRAKALRISGHVLMLGATASHIELAVRDIHLQRNH